MNAIVYAKNGAKGHSIMYLVLYIFIDSYRRSLIFPGFEHLRRLEILSFSNPC